LCAIVPFFVTLGTVFEEKNALRNADNILIFSLGDKSEKGASLSMLRVIRLVRVFRLGFRYTHTPSHTFDPHALIRLPIGISVC
jgi:hypothetical protein